MYYVICLGRDREVSVLLRMDPMLVLVPLPPSYFADRPGYQVQRLTYPACLACLAGLARLVLGSRFAASTAIL